MNRAEIGERLASRAGMSNAMAKDAVDGVFEAIAEALVKDNAVRIVGFGMLGTRTRPTRTGRNSRTGESLPMAVSTVPVFKLGNGLRDNVNEGENGARFVRRGGMQPPGVNERHENGPRRSH